MIFLSRELLWLLLVIPGLIGAYVLLIRRKRHALRYPSLRLVRDAVGRTQSFRRHLPPAPLLLSVIALVLALAPPAGGAPMLSAPRTNVLTIDVSLRMAATHV